MLAFTGTNVGLWWVSGYCGSLHVLEVQPEDTAQRSADAVSSARRKLRFPMLERA